MMEVTDLSDTSFTWYSVKFDKAKPHFVSKQLLLTILASMISRDYEMIEINPIDAIDLDIGGPVYTGMPEEMIKLDGAQIFMWSHQVATITNHTCEYAAKIRRYAYGKPYYKIHFYDACLVLSRDQYIIFLDALNLIFDKAADEAIIFFDKLKLLKKKK